MAEVITEIRLDTELADKAVKVLGVDSRAEAVKAALEAVVHQERFRDMLDRFSKRSFRGCDD